MNENITPRTVTITLGTYRYLIEDSMKYEMLCDYFSRLINEKYVQDEELIRILCGLNEDSPD